MYHFLFWILTRRIRNKQIRNKRIRIKFEQTRIAHINKSTRIYSFSEQFLYLSPVSNLN